MVRFGPGDTKILLPAMEMMEGTYAGRRCCVTRVMATTRGLSEDELIEMTGLPRLILHRVITRMTVEGTTFVMMHDNRKHYYLTDRAGWVEAVYNERPRVCPVGTPWCVVNQERPRDEGP